MKYEHTLFEGYLIKRYKRFMADIERLDGTQLTIHCPNTGSMKNCIYPGKKIWYSDSKNPKRKYVCTWEQAEVSITIDGKEKTATAGVNTGRANWLVEELLSKGGVPELLGYRDISREIRYGHENSRIDLLLQSDEQPDCFIEVKSVTLSVGDGLGLFPDAVTTRGTKHLRELISIRNEGKRAVLFFCVQHTGIERVGVAEEIDPEYAKTMHQAVAAGVEVMAWGAADMSPETIELTRPLPVIL
ncbi:MAG: DNA/RNA nuclease SfsA [Candidatus Endonucleobacter bathymodioli]|uniref:Sugar fermentation stimulation protein homolog n=1 Tax=Candidatus Endonucleibacter bathymodioli TaxID=539814 RepID=A0AA90SDN1_9GAMM|nr:DNA/RNA nuclease SfsA [Candidatus Endonucleobacter bathymodioli]